MSNLVAHRTLLVGDQDTAARDGGTQQALDQALVKIAITVSNSDAKGWFAHRGYATH